MRELKFRVWDKANNRYLRRDSTGIDNLGNIIDFENCDEDDRGVHNVRVLGKNDMGFTTEQYTGLHDKNGKEIYEGDILSIPRRKDKKKDKLYTVVWHKTHARLNFANTNGEFGEISIGKIIRSQIVGNIHENSELLENKK